MLDCKRVLIKISGEALSGDNNHGIDFTFVDRLSSIIKECYDLNKEIAIVVGGGNFWRGIQNGKTDMDRTRSDHMGMLATTMNSLALASCLEQIGVPVKVQSAIDMHRIADPYIRANAISHLENKKVVIFACGTGNPYFSTDTGAVLRAAEINADIILLAKNIDGIYNCDPKTNSNAIKYEKITYKEILEKQLRVLDLTATSLALDNKIPILVFGIKNPDNIYKVICGEKLGTIVSHE